LLVTDSLKNLQIHSRLYGEFFVGSSFGVYFILTQDLSLRSR
jgi:hypothetical protein